MGFPISGNICNIQSKSVFLPSGTLTVCYGKWPSRNDVDFPMKIAWWIFPVRYEKLPEGNSNEHESPTFSAPTAFLSVPSASHGAGIRIKKDLYTKLCHKNHQFFDVPSGARLHRY